jgi:hypothetical protein
LYCQQILPGPEDEGDAGVKTSGWGGIGASLAHSSDTSGSRHGAQSQLAALHAQQQAGTAAAAQSLLASLGALDSTAFPAVKQSSAAAASTLAASTASATAAATAAAGGTGASGSSGGHTSGEPSPRVVLTLACLCREIGSALVPRAAELLARRAPLAARALQEMDEAVKYVLQ